MHVLLGGRQAVRHLLGLLDQSHLEAVAGSTCLAKPASLLSSINLQIGEESWLSSAICLEAETLSHWPEEVAHVDSFLSLVYRVETSTHGPVTATTNTDKKGRTNSRKYQKSRLGSLWSVTNPVVFTL